MNNDIQIYNNSQFGDIRIAQADNGEPVFNARDIAAALGYKRTSDAINAHCRGAAIYRPIIDRLGREQKARFLTEGDVYRLIVSSKLESAQAFEAWLFDEVLPAIRRTGGYIAAREDESPEEILARALIVAKDTIERKDKRIAELEPKALFADAVGASDGTCLVGELAKMLRQNGVDIGQNRLFEWLRQNGYLGKQDSNRNVPTQKAMELGLFRIKETAITHSDGHVTITRTPKVTGKGQRYFFEKFKGAA